jgi:pyruvate-ferredoxin/flavodoxin oxidoreductase
VKIIGEETDRHAQAYFVYDSKKSGSVTTSHLRFGPRPIRAPYLIERASFVACHQFSLVERLDVLATAERGATFLLNSPAGPDAVWDRLPRGVQEQILEKQLRLFVVDAERVARAAGMGGRINMVMQTCFFALSGVLPPADAIAAIKRSIEKTYGRRGEAVVRRNHAAVDAALSALHEVAVPATVTSRTERRPPVAQCAPPFVQRVTAPIMAGAGDRLPVSALPADGVYPTGTAQWEKRGLSHEIPVWRDDICIQCGKCVLVCPHAVIRAKVYPPERADGAPPGWKARPARWRDRGDQLYTLEVAPDDCTGCGLCVEICPVKDKSQTRLRAVNLEPLAPVRDQARDRWQFFLEVEDADRGRLNHHQVKDVQLFQPLFEFSGACAGCGETPYLKLLSQLFGSRALIANATGCSSIYGGNLPTTPWTKDREGRGPAWANSLFEDNAEFGLGLRLARDQQAAYARTLLPQVAAVVGDDLVAAILGADQTTEAGIAAQRDRMATLLAALRDRTDRVALDLTHVAETLVRSSVWIVGGDGWAYDIGYGGLDHVMASGANVKVLVLDTEVYSNTGGQMSKATPRAAVAKFAAGGKPAAKKDLGLLLMTYGHVYVAAVALGADDMHTLKVFHEAESYDGPAVIIAYSPCIAHGYDLVRSLDQSRAAVQAGAWPLFRYDPRRRQEGKNPLQLDSKPPSLPFRQYAYNETRYTMLAHADAEAAAAALAAAEADARRRWQTYERLAAAPEGVP